MLKKSLLTALCFVPLISLANNFQKKLTAVVKKNFTSSSVFNPTALMKSCRDAEFTNPHIEVNPNGKNIMLDASFTRKIERDLIELFEYVNCSLDVYLHDENLRLDAYDFAAAVGRMENLFDIVHGLKETNKISFDQTTKIAHALAELAYATIFYADYVLELSFTKKYPKPEKYYSIKGYCTFIKKLIRELMNDVRLKLFREYSEPELTHARRAYLAQRDEILKNITATIIWQADYLINAEKEIK